MLDLLQHLPLIVCMLDLLHLDHLLLLQNLDGVEPLVVLGLDQVDTTKASRSQRPLYLEISQRVFALGLPEDGLLRSLGAAVMMALVSMCGLACAIVLRGVRDVVDGRLVLLLLRDRLCHVGRLARGDGRPLGWLLCSVLCGGGLGGLLRQLFFLDAGVRRNPVDRVVKRPRVRGKDWTRRLARGRGGRRGVVGTRQILRPFLLEEPECRHMRCGQVLGVDVTRSSIDGNAARPKTSGADQDNQVR